MQAGFAAWRQLGHSTATSRAGMGTAALYLEVERAAAEFLGYEASAYLPSGYLSTLAGLKALRAMKAFDVIFIDEHAHYCGFDAARATGCPVHVVQHARPGNLEELLESELRPGQVPLLLSDGIFPTLGDVFPADVYAGVLERYGGLLWLDEAHSFGVIGPNGGGVYDHYGLTGDRFFSGGTLAKAFGGFGGIIPGDRPFIEAVLGDEVIAGASAAAPPLAAATLTGIKLLCANPQWRDKLRSNARRLKHGLQGLGFDMKDNDVPIATLSLGDEDSMAHVKHTLMERDIAIQHAHYSGVGEEGVLRMVVFSTHTDEQIDRLIEELRRLV
jgi:glycine C-acetyltransferase/8-amino-7-oxononanoate synthase